MIYFCIIKRKEKINRLKKCGKTFCSKFFFKLASSIIDPQIMCLQILQYQKANRKKEEIELTLPMLLTLSNFIDYYCSGETNNEVIEEKKSSGLYSASTTWIIFFSTGGNFV